MGNHAVLEMPLVSSAGPSPVLVRAQESVSRGPDESGGVVAPVNDVICVATNRVRGPEGHFRSICSRIRLDTTTLVALFRRKTEAQSHSHLLSNREPEQSLAFDAASIDHLCCRCPRGAFARITLDFGTGQLSFGAGQSSFEAVSLRSEYIGLPDFCLDSHL